MREFEYTFSTRVDFSDDVRDHAFVLRCLPRRGEGVTVVRESLAIDPTCRFARQRDSFGNELAVGSVRAAHGHISYRSSGIVRIEAPDDIADSPSPHPLYRYASPLATTDENLGHWALEHGFDAAAFAGSPDAARDAFVQLGHAIHEIMAYEPGSTGVSTTAAEAFSRRSGVCQDFAHIAIAVLRQAGVPARYVSGLAVGQGTTHAWVQAYIGNAWRGFDPTRDVPVDDAYLPLAVGRDWQDCPVERGSFWGLVDQMQTVFMTMEERGPADR